MAFKVRDYSGGDEFVPPSAFGNSKLWGQGPREPNNQNLGPTSDQNFRGEAWGGVRDDDGARMMDAVRRKKQEFRKLGMPENA